MSYYINLPCKYESNSLNEIIAFREGFIQACIFQIPYYFVDHKTKDAIYKQAIEGMKIKDETGEIVA